MDIVKIIQEIYYYEYSVRISFQFDLGYNWFLLDNNKPSRLGTDLSIIEDQLSIDAALEPDWIATGYDSSFEQAIIDLANAIAMMYPKGQFAVWFNVYMSHRKLKERTDVKSC